MTTTPTDFGISKKDMRIDEMNAPPLRCLYRATLLCIQILTLSENAALSLAVRNEDGLACTTYALT